MMKNKRTLRRVGLVAGTTMLALAAIGPAASPAFAKPSGSIWTTGEDCTSPAPQNDNLYAAGETIYVRGSNFEASAAFSWTVTGKPGGASGDPNQDVTTGNDTTDDAGAFCIAAYVVAADDWGEYSVKVDQGSTQKNDNYRVERVIEDPEDEDTTPPSDEDTTEDTTTEDTTTEDTTTEDTTTEDTTPPAGDQTVAAIDDVSTETFTQSVLGVVSSGPAATPPPTDMVVAPSDQGSGIDGRIILAFLGVLILAATIGLPERRRAN